MWDKGRHRESILVMNQGLSSLSPFPSGSKGKERRNEDKHVAEETPDMLPYKPAYMYPALRWEWVRVQVCGWDRLKK